jgi:hypothetical protein
LEAELDVRAFAVALAMRAVVALGLPSETAMRLWALMASKNEARSSAPSASRYSRMRSSRLRPLALASKVRVVRVPSGLMKERVAKSLAAFFSTEIALATPP